jgi:alanyl-tRNA synthetase
LQSSEIRESFLKFFEKKAHKRLPSSSLIPDDPTLLLTAAGMVQFKPYFLGKATSPYPRITTCQKCVRTSDIEMVGKTARHLTFFEMLGNFSFGDYYKEEAINWAWEFVTEYLKIDPKRLWVTIYYKDEEASDIWQKEVGVPPSRIVRLREDDNFWAAGPTGPCGPCSEIIFDRGEKYGCGKPDCKVGCDCDRYLELWNLVFMELERDEKGNLKPLPRKNIDTGMGLERAALVKQEAESVFQTDLFSPLSQRLNEFLGDESDEVSRRIILDHSRAAAFLISDGVIPSNEGRGYVLRRIIRRAVMHARKMGIEENFLGPLAEVLVKEMGLIYPELRENQKFILNLIQAEEERFSRTLEQGLRILEEKLSTLSQGEKVPGKTIFELYDTYGFPFELTKEIAGEKGFLLDEEDFHRLLEEQKERSRREWMERERGESDFAPLLKEYPETEFLGYSEFEVEGKVLALIKGEELVEELKEGEEGGVLLDRTPFYAEMGGQVGDKGKLSTEKLLFEVADTQAPLPNLYLHLGRVKKGTIRVGEAVRAQVDVRRRKRIARNHTATHLLHWALRLVLGEHVRQAGSLVSADGFRFDYSHFKAPTEEELEKIEILVNQKVIEDHPVKAYVTSLEHAKEIGAIALFGEKYGEFVRVLEVGNFSRELCGGTHIHSTGEIGLFKIVSEESIGANLRRIEAKTGDVAFDWVRRREKILKEISKILKSKLEDTPEKVKSLLKETHELKSKLKKLKEDLLKSLAEEALFEVETVDSISVLAKKFQVDEPDDLRILADYLREGKGEGAYLLGGACGGKAYLLMVATPEAVKKGINAKEVIGEVAKIIKGGGGGRENFAQAGGKEVNSLPEALERGLRLIKDKLANG